MADQDADNILDAIEDDRISKARRAKDPRVRERDALDKKYPHLAGKTFNVFPGFGLLEQDLAPHIWPPIEELSKEEIAVRREALDTRHPFLKGKTLRLFPRPLSGPRQMRYNIPADRFHGYREPTSEANTEALAEKLDAVLGVMQDIREMMRRQPPRAAPPSAQAPRDPKALGTIEEKYKGEFDA